MQDRIEPRKHYDLAVIGGGVHGAAVAWEAALAGAKVALFEQQDFGSGTSANSLKIIHGGLRYLQDFDLARSRAYAREQDRLVTWFPHLVRPLPCIMPTYSGWKKGRLVMGCGIQFYEALAWPRTLPRGSLLSAADTRSKIAGAWRAGMTGGALWYDAQVYNGERLVLSYALSARSEGADVFNYISVCDLTKRDANMELRVRDQLNNSEHVVSAACVVDARGATEQVFGQDAARERPRTVPQQKYTRAVNIVFKMPFIATAVGLQLSGGTAHKEDRLLFLAPWRGATLAGTWYFPDRPERVITRSELAACLSDLRSVVPGMDWSEQSIDWVHIGRLPLANDDQSLLDRPKIVPSPQWPQLIKLVGVKYSNARLVAETLVRRLFGRPRGRRLIYGGQYANWEQYRTEAMDRFGHALGHDTVDRLTMNYGSLCERILESDGAVRTGEPARLDGSDILLEEVQHACEQESAYTIGDVLLRRTGLGALAPPAAETTAHCAAILARRYDWDTARVQREMQDMAAYYERIIDE